MRIERAFWLAMTTGALVVALALAFALRGWRPRAVDPIREHPRCDLV